jgi:uncharacterized repeat protein (TIGR03803 family)
VYQTLVWLRRLVEFIGASVMIAALAACGDGGSTDGTNPTPPTAASPTFSPGAGSYATAQTVSLATTTAGASIYYTTNGTAPTTSSTKYTGAITVGSTETIEALAVASGYSNSAVASAAYQITPVVTPVAATPVFSPAAGSYSAAQTVSISDATAGASIYYTTNGTTPTTSSTKYTGAIAVSSTETIKALAVAGGYTDSAVASATYTITAPKACTPVSPAGSILYSFGGSTGDAAAPEGLMPRANGTFYGTSLAGGTNGLGSVFTLSPSGQESVLYSFNDAVVPDGIHPHAPLIQGSDGNFYGTTNQGGANGAGTVYQVTPSGIETVLRGGPAFLDGFRGRDKCNSIGYAAAASS